MANYAVGAVLAADLRAAIRAARGDWIDGDPGWYAWVSERVYRFGLERSAGDVLRDVLGPRAERGGAARRHRAGAERAGLIDRRSRRRPAKVSASSRGAASGGAGSGCRRRRR